MNLTTTVTDKGQITIPEQIRDLLGIMPGDKAVVQRTSTKKRELTFKVINTPSVVNKLSGSLKTDLPYMDMKTVRDIAGKKLAQKYRVK